MSGGLGQNNRWSRISKSLKTQEVIQGVVSNVRLIDAEGQKSQAFSIYKAITVKNKLY